MTVPGPSSTSWFAEYAMLPGGLARNVTIEITDGRFSAVLPNSDPSGAVGLSARLLPGVVLPGFANSHSHAFHRALRGRTHDRGGTFWTWRARMYAVAAQLDPDSYLALARATYAEMALAGVTAVGEFHYLHHGPGGARYADENVMGQALCQAAADAGIRLTLLDTCYLVGGLEASGHLPLDEVQQRFADRDVDAWAERVEGLASSDGVRVGAAIHSVRAVPRAAVAVVAKAATGRPLHVHLSEQPAENQACLAYYGCTPTELLDAEGALGTATTAVHATHLSTGDIATLGRTGTTACFCPTTERDLADGIGPARALRDAGAPLSLGSDQHAVVDLIEEARALELNERLLSGRRGRFQPKELLARLTNHASIGWGHAWPIGAGQIGAGQIGAGQIGAGQIGVGQIGAGQIAVGARADLVAIRLDTVRTAGSSADQILLSASAADIDTVVVDGSIVVQAGRHRLGDVGTLLARAIEPLWEGIA